MFPPNYEMAVDMSCFGGTIKGTRGGASRGFLRLATTQSNQISGVVQQDYEQFSRALKRQAEQVARLEQGLRLLQSEQLQLEEVASHLVSPLVSCDGTNAITPSSILACVRRLAVATYAGQLFDVLVQEAARLNVRTVVFDVRARAAWAASASGYGSEISSDDICELVVSLNHDSPFRQVFETAEAVETNAAGLDKNRNVLAKLGVSENGRILLAPVRSADSVVAILYADIGEERNSRLIDSLKVLAEFAGAQFDRLTALSVSFAGEVVARSAELESSASEPVRAKLERGIATPEPEGVASREGPEVAATKAKLEALGFAPTDRGLASEASAAIAQPSEGNQAASNSTEIAQRTEAEEKIHCDARRFSRLLVSEIELYNKNSVEEGRRNKDLYQRLKKDIDRSRETYEKRFAHTAAREVDYFHEELVRVLAQDDLLLLGSGYPGPSV
jgi:hypothetical protein